MIQPGEDCLLVILIISLEILATCCRPPAYHRP